MKLIYVCGGDCSVFESQVMELLDYYQTKDIEITLLEGYSSDAERKNLETKLSNHAACRVVWFHTYPFYSFFKSAMIRSVRKALKQVGDLNDTAIHVRGGYQGYIVCEALKAESMVLPVVVDIRGVRVEELKYLVLRQRGVRRILSQLQLKYINQSAQSFFSSDYGRVAVTSVSPAINEHFRKSYTGYCYPMYMHPNISGTSFVYSELLRQKTRMKFGFSDNDVVAICATGGNGLWQKDFQVVERLASLGVKVINLSKNQFDIKGVVTTTVPFSQMPAMLSAADIAVLWRDNTFMNQSASPSKFSEFATMGLYVIHNGSVAIASEYIQKSGAGMLVGSTDEITSVPSIEYLRGNRDLWISEGKQSFGVNRLGDSLLQIYQSL